MGMYMYPIKIDRGAKLVSYSKEYDLPDLELSLSELKKYVSNDETFQINSEEHKIYVFGKRFETKEEVAKRVQKEEKYMENYNEFHKNKAG
jgi:hypothetical protein